MGRRRILDADPNLGFSARHQISGVFPRKVIFHGNNQPKGSENHAGLY
jgi:hypothetical protein